MNMILRFNVTARCVERDPIGVGLPILIDDSVGKRPEKRVEDEDNRNTLFL